jgi:hypothetical protein
MTTGGYTIPGQTYTINYGHGVGSRTYTTQDWYEEEKTTYIYITVNISGDKD